VDVVEIICCRLKPSMRDKDRAKRGFCLCLYNSVPRVVEYGRDSWRSLKLKPVQIFGEVKALDA